jgi:hypothetical protein
MKFKNNNWAKWSFDKYKFGINLKSYNDEDHSDTTYEKGNNSYTHNDYIVIRQEDSDKSKDTERWFLKPISVIKKNSVIVVPKSDNSNIGKLRNGSEEETLMKLIKFQIYLPTLSLTCKVRSKLKWDGSISSIGENKNSKVFKIEKWDKGSKIIKANENSVLFKISRFSKYFI